MYTNNYALELIRNGVHIPRPESVIIESTVEVALGTIIYPNVVLLGNTIIGKDVILHQGVELSDSTVGDNTRIKMCCEVRDSIIGSECTIKPFVRVESCDLSDFVNVDSYTVLKNTNINRVVKIGSNVYIAHTVIHEGVLVSPGVITANYDGVMKHSTVIEDNVFIGSDVQLIAPVTIHHGATIAAGSVITKDAPPHTLTISRSPQLSIKGWSRPHKTMETKADNPPNLSVPQSTTDSYKETIREFQKLLEKNVQEEQYHEFVKNHYWLIGSGYESCLNKVRAGAKHVPDLILERDDGSFDIVELKKPSANLFLKNKKHIVESSELKFAIGQLDEYLHYYRVHYLSESHLSRRDFYVSSGILIIGRTNNEEERKGLRRVSERYKDIKIMSYDDLLAVGKRLINLVESERYK